MVHTTDSLIEAIMPDGGEHGPFTLGTILREGDDIATMSDADLIDRFASWLDRPSSEFAGMVVSRPPSGNILIMAKPEFGS